MSRLNKTKRVDFINSSFGWNGASKGIFNIISLLIYKSIDEERKKETFALGQSVLAGNMYSDKELLKHPSYMFQLAGSISEQSIFRSFISEIPESGKTLDNYDELIFEDFQVNIKNEKARIVEKFYDIKSLFSRNRFSAKIFFKMDSYDINLEFPIYHINIKKKNKMWQVETGPILFPLIEKDKVSPKHIPSFIHFNSFDKLDICYDYPFRFRSINMSNQGIVSRFPCTIQLFA